MSYLLYRLKWRFNQFFSLPAHIDIELNNNCNQKCIFCWHSDPETRPFNIALMPLEQAVSVINQAAFLGIKSAKFNLRGEPLVYGHLSSVLHYAKKRGLYTMLNTNGQLISRNKNIFQYLDELIISVDSFNHLTYCKLHNASMSDYYDLRETLEILHFEKKRGKIKTRIKINVHRNEFNADESFIRWMAHFPLFKFVIRDTMKREGTDVSIKRARKRKSTCYHAPRRLTVLSNGDVYPCCVCYANPDDIKLAENYEIITAVCNPKRKHIYKHWNEYLSCVKCTSADNYR